MSDRPMPVSDERAELVHRFAGPPAARRPAALAGHLANVACYPWDANAGLGWNHTLRQPGTIPDHPEAAALILLRPREAPDLLTLAGHDVRWLQVVALLAEEHLLAKAEGVDALEARWLVAGIDPPNDRR
jgi:hypothetical protein